MRRAYRCLGALAALVICIPGAARASAGAPAGGGNPHGDLDIPCSVCHVTESWRVEGTPPGFDHAKQTGFPLEGAHRGASCAGCHRDPVFSRVGILCADCHVDVHRGELGLSCEGCHESTTWTPKDAAVDRHVSTRFPLVGAHATVDCEACHVGVEPGEFASTPVECSGCHMEAYTAATDPDHARLGFDLDCEQCHPAAARSWRPSTFAHAGFPLSGAHARTDCDQCHTGGTYAGTPTECFDCHDDDYAAVTDPVHTLPDFPHECDTCHGFESWSGGSFNHAMFPLQGAHARISCAACHGGGSYTGTPTECFGCHDDDYAAVPDPVHTLPDFPQECEVCHGLTSWSPATFEHAIFPLEGAHAQASCSSCHAGSYTGTPTLCYDCHADDYAAADPPHLLPDFPHECEVCHGVSTWSGAVFDHDGPFFPIYSGAHNGRWSTCADCHVNPGSYAQFECITCHEHAQPDMDAHHNQVQNYQYLSSACYECHPDGTH